MESKEIYFNRRNLQGESEDYPGRNTSFDKEIERYSVIAGHFREHPSRFTESNKKSLEKIFLRMLYILKKDIPAKTERTCLNTLHYLSNKLDFKTE